MALTGLQIHKLLPKTNCKECGSNTCLAFAMKLAAKNAELSACPYASDEAKRVLGAAAEPPVRSVALGPKRDVRIGGETVLYRHEKTFVNRTLLAVNVNDGDPRDKSEATLAAIKAYTLERVGQTFAIDLVAVTQTGDSADAFAALARTAWETTGRPLVLLSRDPSALRAAAEAVKGSGSILASATPETAEALAAVARENEHALTLTAPDLDSLVALSHRVKESGLRDLLLELPAPSLGEAFRANTVARRAALKGDVKALGLPTLRVIDAGSVLGQAAAATTEICKYGGIVVLPTFDPALLSSLMTLRLNIFTDPQQPIQVEPKIYPVGDPRPDSPVFVTTNFSLTYFLVSGEIENAGLSAWLIVPECEGMSVLTAWAAGKFSGTSIAKFCRAAGLDELVQTRKMIIPGYVAQISGELEEGLPGWSVLVGPQEASDLESFVKAHGFV